MSYPIPTMWHPCTGNSPPDNTVVLTMIADPDRNIQPLKRRGNLWWFPDGSMYVYYVPTHWAPTFTESHTIPPTPTPTH